MKFGNVSPCELISKTLKIVSSDSGRKTDFISISMDVSALKWSKFKIHFDSRVEGPKRKCCSGEMRNKAKSMSFTGSSFGVLAKSQSLDGTDVRDISLRLWTNSFPFQAMARDEKNYYQDTPKQIRRKILTFKSIPEQYNAYLSSKEEGTLDMDTSWLKMDLLSHISNLMDSNCGRWMTAFLQKPWFLGRARLSPDGIITSASWLCRTPHPPRHQTLDPPPHMTWWPRDGNYVT